MLQLILQHAFETLNLNRIYLRVFATNARAKRSYEKAGLVLEGTMRQAVFRNGTVHRHAHHEHPALGVANRTGGEMISHSHPHEMKVYGEIKLFAGSGSPELSRKISEYLESPLCDRELVEFPNENLFIRLKHSVRGQDVYVIQQTATPVHRNLMELLITLQTLRLDSAARITAVIPYLCYGRSDKKDQPRVPITGRLVADMIEVAGADRYMTLDPHAGQIQGFFSIPGDVLTASRLIIDEITHNVAAQAAQPGRGRHRPGLREEGAQLRGRPGDAGRLHREAARGQRRARRSSFPYRRCCRKRRSDRGR